MKEKIYNYDKLKIDEIDDKVIRVKALIINSKNELLLAEAFTTIQFPGGHLEDGETLNEALIREIKEETGIKLKGNYHPFYSIKYYLKDYPVIGNNRSLEIYYFIIKTDELFNSKKINLDDQEKNGNFKLYYVPINKLKKVLKKNIKLLEINKVVTSEMLLAVKEYKKYVKRYKDGD